MKKKDLEIKLESVKPFVNPDPSLEQYPTPSVIASDILFWAYSNGDIQDMYVADLGCGTGIFSIGSYLLGAANVKGYDISESALNIAKENASNLNCEIEFYQHNIKDVENECDTVIMNPPFGSQKKHADRPFLEKAMEISECVYSIHMECTLPFLKETVSSYGREIVSYKTYKYEIPHTFSFHSKTKQSVDIVAVNIR